MWLFGTGKVEKSRAELLELVRQGDEARSRQIATDPDARFSYEFVVNEARGIVAGRHSRVSFDDAARRAGLPPGRRRGAPEQPPAWPEDETNLVLFHKLLEHGGLIATYREASHQISPAPLVEPTHFTKAFQTLLFIPGLAGDLLLRADSHVLIDFALGRSDLVRAENRLRGNSSLLGPCPRDPDRALHWAQAVHALIVVEQGCQTPLNFDVVATPPVLDSGLSF